MAEHRHKDVDRGTFLRGIDWSLDGSRDWGWGCLPAVTVIRLYAQVSAPSVHSPGGYLLSKYWDKWCAETIHGFCRPHVFHMFR